MARKRFVHQPENNGEVTMDTVHDGSLDGAVMALETVTFDNVQKYARSFYDMRDAVDLVMRARRAVNAAHTAVYESEKAAEKMRIDWYTRGTP